MFENIITVCFIVVMTINIIVAIRHWMMIRQMNFALKRFMESNRQFSEIMEQHHDRSRPIAPTDP